MNLFVKSLVYFALCSIILLTLFYVIFRWGFGQAAKDWGSARLSELENLARSLLNDTYNTNSIQVPQDLPFFVYDKEKNLIFSNRGYGRQQGRDNLQTIAEEDGIKGYYFAGSIRFRDNSANIKFMDTLESVMLIGFSLSFIIAFIFAFIFSRSLSYPAQKLVWGLGKITRGDLQVHIEEKGTSEIMSIARSVNTLAQKLKHEQEIRHRWTQDITHDLRTPISAVKAQFEGMADGTLDLTKDRIKKNIMQITRVEQLVGDLEEIMYLESPELKLNLTTIKLKPFWQGIINLFSYDINKKELSTSLELAVEDLYADEKLMHRAFSNLLSNAVRYSNNGGWIKITSTKQQNKTIIEICNSGDAIPQEKQDKIFDRLYRGEWSRSSPGSGLGLTITRKIVELHGGSISVQSEKNDKTCFIIHI